ncbi:hypothetical protein [Nocardia nepalensis]|uniref:hypothetical protein n=1 Tax=Nocardia nepalensis TaxID=3375448 RepID=UPI003B67044E
MLSTTATFKRRFARVAVAGALVSIPLGALAVTASAAEPDSSAAQSVSDPIPLEGTDIGRPHHWSDEFPDGPGPRVEFRGPDDRHCPGDGPHVFFQHFRPPTGSAGSS